MQEDLDGTLEELETLCAENRNIKRLEEGRLKRFGMKFHTLVKKLSKVPAIILNKEACRRYLDALERGFAEMLRMAINTRNLIKEDLLQAGGNAPPVVVPNTVDHRKEDPIVLEELIKMAEQLANKGSTEIERRDARLEELDGELFGLRDMLAVTQMQSKATHEELLKVFQNARCPAPTQGETEDEFDVLRDEIRTLRVKLNQVASGGPSMFRPTPMPVMQLQAQVNPYTNQAAPVPPVNMEELGRTVFNMMRASNYMQDQYIQTRGKVRNVAFAEPPELVC
ncbi:hypothetical protein DFH08DRAFT_813664 [Mycena albidolilacea]|uniref:Uncharacterized protein n=1 Tax=Mycena albidolilacea TaxID=1033008 RepID=A0AAD6ZQN8_9AGAR|nr:hypothetical protein DFH08DRAFT_813664 [Mycena albidolilacea]